MKINFKVRAKNPAFWIQIATAILVTIVGYAGINGSDVTTWKKLFDLIVMAISNPYCLMLVAMAVWNAINDPTTKGFGDSNQALEYEKPKESDN
jgi:phi LC3 family holin